MGEAEQRSRAYYERRARIYDLSNRVAALLRGASPTRERRKAVRRLRAKPGDRVLEVSVGTGTNLPLLSQETGGAAHLVGLDISRGMLSVCARKLARKAVASELIEGDASRLPFSEGSFDAVFHHGGIAEFGDRKAAINEMWRVVKRGGRVVVCDVGVPTDRRLSLVNRLLLRLQPEYNKPPPLEEVPPDAADVRLSWYFGGSWYLIEFTKPEA